MTNNVERARRLGEWTDDEFEEIIRLGEIEYVRLHHPEMAELAGVADGVLDATANIVIYEQEEIKNDENK